MTLLRDGCQYISNIIKKEEAEDLKNRLFRDALNVAGNLDGHYDPDRGQVLTCYLPKDAAHLVWKIKIILENLMGEELIPTFWFCTIYQNGGKLTRHFDRPACEISVSMNLSSNISWPLKMKDFSGKRRDFVTPPGDGVAYFGCELAHWRSPLRLSDNEKFTQIFLHYVRKNGQYADFAYDRLKESFDLLQDRKMFKPVIM